MLNKHPSDSHVQVRVGDPVLIGFLTKGLKSGSLELSQTPHLMGKWEAVLQFRKACVCGGERKRKTWEARSCLLSFLGWAREKLPAGVGAWRASECATRLALWGMGGK